MECQRWEGCWVRGRGRRVGWEEKAAGCLLRLPAGLIGAEPSVLRRVHQRLTHQAGECSGSLPAQPPTRRLRWSPKNVPALSPAAAAPAWRSGHEMWQWPVNGTAAPCGACWRKRHLLTPKKTQRNKGLVLAVVGVV